MDVAQFEALARSDAAADIERAAALYRGPLLDGMVVRDAEGDQWLFRERERLRDVLLAALDRLLERQIQQGCLERATETAARILSEDPLASRR
jgi:DNA-binding SARP family transcriptional activator